MTCTWNYGNRIGQAWGNESYGLAHSHPPWPLWRHLLPTTRFRISHQGQGSICSWVWVSSKQVVPTTSCEGERKAPARVQKDCRRRVTWWPINLLDEVRKNNLNCLPSVKSVASTGVMPSSIKLRLQKTLLDTVFLCTSLVNPWDIDGVGKSCSHADMLHDMTSLDCQISAIRGLFFPLRLMRSLRNPNRATREDVWAG